jgi:DNA polymerase sigma
MIPPQADKFTNLYKDALLRRERQDKVYSACLEPECTFIPDTTGSKYYYNRLEARDPAYKQRNASPHNESQQYVNRHRSRHYRNLSEGLNEKERL